jgi:hypothetical protein
MVSTRNMASLILFQYHTRGVYRLVQHLERLCMLRLKSFKVLQ